jgi:hypothetical protein
MVPTPFNDCCSEKERLFCFQYNTKRTGRKELFQKDVSAAQKTISHSGRAARSASISSALMGLPGGWWMAGTIPTDLAQFYGHVLSLMQKLMYLYGWPPLTDINNQLDDESLNIMTLFVGVMMGNKLAIEALGKIVAQASKKVSIKISETLMAKYAIKIAQWIGINMTKEGFAKGAGKVLPLVGAPISATITYYTFRPMARRLKKHLDDLYEMRHFDVRQLEY